MVYTNLRVAGSAMYKELIQTLNVVVYGKSNVISPLGTKLHGSNHAY